MATATSGVCLVRVEQQPKGLLLTVSTDRHDRSNQPVTQHFIDVDDAVSAVRDFLAGFRAAED